jgi:CO dehydrogenase maturation factor
MSRIIAVAGKGGTGKTTVSSLIIRSLIKRGETPILAVDADPNSNLAESIGLDIEDTIGSVLADFLRTRAAIPQGMTKQSFLELRLHQILKEGRDIDMLAMGCPEGPGCYCSVNALLKSYFEDLAQNYKNVVVDNEAGMEHFSRKTANQIDVLIFVSNYTMKGLKTVETISSMIDELGIDVRERYLLISNTPEELNGEFMKRAEELKIPYLGNIVSDSRIEESDISGKPLIELPDDSVAVQSVDSMMNRILH